MLSRLPPLGIAQLAKRKARKCVICHAQIENPTHNQRSCTGECSRELSRRTKRKSLTSKAFKAERRRIGKIANRKPARNRAYLNWLKGCRCVVCQATPCDPCHVGVRGLRQKSRDLDALPMCRIHHNAQHQLGKQFWPAYELDKDVLVAAFNMAWAELQEGAAA